MYLKSLTLRGFKSFADRTVMSFDPGLTVVVGPNGSGKSNVSDAILWVLGEQSAKMLRGQAMEDVIFSGSSARKPVGLAEVTLVLDNSDRTLPVDFEEVAITRRMYRSGESEYLINAAPARLRDIQDILHDSGLGKDTHSIISQGKLDSVLSSRAEERRSLIEEAADISKHRRRKERSERKLASMDKNLVRAKDIQREVARQLRPLERQVDRAKRAGEIQERLAEVSTMLAVDDLRQLQAAWNALKSRDAEAEAEVELTRYRVGEKQRELDRLQSMLEQKGLFVGDLDAQRRRASASLGRMESDMRLLEEKGRNMVARISEMRMSLSTGERERADAAAELGRVRADLAEAGAARETLEARVAELEPAAKAATSTRADLDARHATLSAELREALRSADAETAAYSRVRDAISSAEVEDSMFASRLEQLEETISVAGEALATWEQRRTDTQAALDAARAAQNEAREQLARQRAGAEAARSAEDVARDELAQARARLSALVAVDAAAQDKSPLVAKVAASKEAKELVSCRLGDLVEAPTELEGVVERLLGEDIAALVVEGPDELARLSGVALGLAAGGGEATMARLGLEGSAATPAGAGTPLIDELDVDERARGLFARLLGNVRVVPTLDAALKAAAAGSDATYVTLDGATVHADGRVVVAGKSAEGQGALERKRQIRSLERGMAKLERAQREAADAHQRAQEALSQASEALAACQGEEARLAGEMRSVAAEVARLQDQQSKALNEQADVSRRREQAAARLEAARPELDRHRAASEEASARAAELSGSIEELSRERTLAQDAEAAATRDLSAARLELATVSERVRHQQSRVTELERRMSTLAGRAEGVESAVRALEVLVQRVEPLHERYDAIHESALAWARRLRDRASLAEADSDSLKKTIGDARTAVSDASSALERAQAAAGELKVEAGRLEVQVETAINNIRADGAMDLEDALRLPEPEDRSALEREAVTLRQRLEDIGPVNQVAFDEYTRLKERADFIGEQVADLETARKALTRITQAIDRKMRNQFLVTFDAVNENFRQVFSVLFPGGRAHLELTDPDDPMASGVEVVAQPRGKRLAKMTLMSGGEKSLTALALLFAVYRTRTVPFYVFDEVEAALDDANLDRLLHAIDALKGTTQLIVISHQRRTMEKADVLYGVSMQADGVSHVISQRLDQATGRVVDA